MNCPYCGAEMREGSVLCTACGRLTPEFERTYRRPDPTVGASRARSMRSYDPDVSRTGQAGGPTNPRLLITLVLGAIALIGAFSFVAGSFLPRETTEAYRNAFEEEYVTEDYEDLIGAYFDAYEKNDTDAIRALFPEALRTEDLDDLDFWADGYGTGLQSYSLLYAEAYSAAEAARIAEQLDAPVDQYVDVGVTVHYADGRQDVAFDFDLVQIDGTWYLYEIW